MPWQAPKTNWRATEIVTATDFNRIEGNIAYIRDEHITGGLEASRPAPGQAGRIYVATDTQRIYQDTGSTWVMVGVVRWADIANKPSAFTPAAHKSTHASGGSDPLTPGDIGAVANTGGVPAILAGEEAARPAAGTAGRIFVATNTQRIYRDTGTAWQLVGVVNWSDVVNKPTTFPPSSHTHPGSDVTSAVPDSDKIDGYHAGTGPNQVLVLDASGLVPVTAVPRTIRHVAVSRTTGWSNTQTNAWEDVLTMAINVASDDELALIYGIVPRVTNTAPGNTIVRCRLLDTNSGVTLAEAAQHVHDAGGSDDWIHFALMGPWVPASGNQTLRLQINSSGAGLQLAADGAGRYAHLWVLLLKRVVTS